MEVQDSQSHEKDGVERNPYLAKLFTCLHKEKGNVYRGVTDASPHWEGSGNTIVSEPAMRFPSLYRFEFEPVCYRRPGLAVA
ncbi:hypothetical protein PoB_003800900 [Plakobranchus ocellatus]|uniref:Uncharacterized protein n=1 Tax=Plakobranchus ocellatus TaxID=259542 RepID=A0AAV4AZJ1_9GAST|nr:hypothetical protein PoB_003800900 [Plakobranchus ocellatus]